MKKNYILFLLVFIASVALGQDDSRIGLRFNKGESASFYDSDYSFIDYKGIGIEREWRVYRWTTVNLNFDYNYGDLTVYEYRNFFTLYPGIIKDISFVSFAASIQQRFFIKNLYLRFGLIFDYDFQDRSLFRYVAFNGLGFSAGLNYDIHLGNKFVLFARANYMFRGILKFKKNSNFDALFDYNEPTLVNEFNIGIAYKFF